MVMEVGMSLNALCRIPISNSKTHEDSSNRSTFFSSTVTTQKPSQQKRPPPMPKIEGGSNPLSLVSMANENFRHRVKRSPNQGLPHTLLRAGCFLGATVPPYIDLSNAAMSSDLLSVHESANGNTAETSHAASEILQRLVLLDLDPATAKLAIAFLGPFLSAFAFLFIVRIVMSWYPKLPVGKFPYVVAYAPTEPILAATRKVIPPLGGVDVTPVVWFGLVSFLNEILVGPQGLLVLVSQQV
ncbi:hypothetical protein RJ640_020978 [Escallonia rubra]|uniref:Protein COFACTOR ASSEMBLY OF COMPLEX C SUBUNIT B CCB3, chloroplastic n=1 Tax=Escallonia rubra TaxID=112253 RepID=A0AA88RFQ6_9ASTE|nr:hypothetical protein RJ640_020978 [Escallonia rubra]